MNKEQTKFEDLSIADLVALHTNYWLSKKEGSRLHLISEKMFYAIEYEIEKRLSKIKEPALKKTDHGLSFLPSPL